MEAFVEKPGLLPPLGPVPPAATSQTAEILGLLDGKVGQPHSGQSLQEKVIHLLGVYI